MEQLCRTLAILGLVGLLNACSGIDGNVTPETLVQRHLDAVYAGDNRPPATVEGRLVIESHDVNAPVIIKTAPPDKRYFEARVLGETVTRSCASGRCWAREFGSAVEELHGEHLDFLAEVSDFHRLNNLERYYRRLETTGVTEFNGQRAYELTLVRNNGNRDKWYFSTDSGLWLGGTWRLPRAMGGVQVTQHFENYQSFDGIKLATRITELTPDQTSKVIVEDVSLGDIPDTAFDIRR